ncbi:cytochrome P450 [Clavulina sp. PMI_390]|nr:cytochrome P450 [Clavulina sp. PMI_390]
MTYSALDSLLLSFPTPSMLSPTLLTFVGFGLILVVALRHSLKPKRTHLPPGPEGEPIIGNARQIPETYAWLHYTELSKQFGDVVYLTAMGQPIIVLSSTKAISDLMVKKSSILSGRPYLAMLGDLVGWDQSVTIGPPSKRWQAQRKLLHQFLGSPAIPLYHNLLQEGAAEFVQRVVPTNEGFMDEFLFTIAKLMLRMAYGIKVDSRRDPLAAMAEEAALNFEDAIELGKFKVNLFPFLRYVPQWFPFADFQRTAAKWRARLNIAIASPFDRVCEDMAAGKAEPSFTARCLENRPAGIEDEHIKWAAGSLYVAAARTTMSTTGCFLLAMILHPEVQAKAQAEIDRETGKERLPTLADRKNMPFIDNILKEVLRWHPATPTGLPHLATEDAEYRGYVIPKGSIVFGNIWALSRDPDMYPSPEKFDPERYEDPNVTDPRDFAFGFGRRVCAGQAFAEATVWITMATLLATVNMKHALDENGKEIPLEEDFAGTMVHDPRPFPYRLEPRAPHLMNLLDATVDAAL